MEIEIKNGEIGMDDKRWIIEQLTSDGLSVIQEELCRIYNKVSEDIKGEANQDIREMIFGNLASMYLQSKVKHDQTHGPLGVDEYINRFNKGEEN